MKTPFYNKVYKLVAKIPRGKVSTYKEIARTLNSKAYRAVGTAMNKNSHWPKVPCHRIINSNGKVGRFASGPRKKVELLRKEGIKIQNGKIDLKKYLSSFR